MHPSLAGRVFGIARKPVEIGLCPGINASIRVDAVIQVNTRIVPVEDIPEAVIGASAQRLNSLSIAGPGRRIIRFRPVSSTSIVGNFGEFTLSLLFAPAHPLLATLEFKQC